MAFQFDQGNSEVVVGFGSGRIEFQGALVMRNGLCETPHQHQYIAQIVVGSRGFGSLLQDLLVPFDRLVKPFKDGQHVGRIVISCKIGRVQADGFLVAVGRLGELFQVHVGESQGVVNFGKIGLQG